MSTRWNTLPECDVCLMSGNHLACLLNDCQARELHDYKVFKTWHEESIKNHNCFACKHCIELSDDRDSCHLCDLIAGDSECEHGLIPIKQSCEHFEAVLWEETDIYKYYAKKKVGDSNGRLSGTS